MYQVTGTCVSDVQENVEIALVAGDFFLIEHICPHGMSS